MEDKIKFRASFENGAFWEYYKDLERQFIEYLNCVPYLDGNETTYSFRLANLILSIGAHIDSAFKEMTKYHKFSRKYPHLLKRDGTPKKLNIKDYNPLISEYELQRVSVDFKRLPERESVTPFSQYKIVNDNVDTPEWWRVYNGIKHEFSENFQKANLKNGRDALAGAFSLNVVHEPVLVRFTEHRLLLDRWKYLPITLYQLETYLKNSRPECIIETEVFFYDYRNGPQYNPVKEK